jgi:NDP-sugar pyrophosphorylase family protein
MKALILAAGFGTRLRPLTLDLPKALLPVNGRPLIEYTLLFLKRHGITEAVINLHHQGEKIVDTLNDGSRWGFKIAYSHEPEILGTGGAIRKVSRELSEGTFLVVNGDVLADFNLGKAIEFHKSRKGAATLILRNDKDAEAWGAIGVDSKDEIRQIRSRPPAPESGLVKRMFSGIHILEPLVFRYLPDGFSNIMDAYVEMIRRGERLMSYVMEGYWMDLGTPERYRQAEESLAKGEVRLSYLKRD